MKTFFSEADVVVIHVMVDIYRPNINTYSWLGDRYVSSEDALKEIMPTRSLTITNGMRHLELLKHNEGRRLREFNTHKAQRRQENKGQSA